MIIDISIMEIHSLDVGNRNFGNVSKNASITEIDTTII